MNNCHKTLEQFILEAVAIHGFLFNYSQFIYVNTHTKGIIICLEHGKFEQTPHDHLMGRGCRQCAKQSRHGNRFKSYDQFLLEAVLAHGNYYDYSEFVYGGTNTKGTIICPRHGRFEQDPKHHILRKQGCNKCSQRPKRTLEELICAARLVHDDNFDYSLAIFINMRTDITIICKSCLVQFDQRPDHHLNGIGCPRCVHIVSKSEIEWLDYMGIPNDKEHRHVSIRTSNNRYNVDGYDPATNTVYEFNGDFWHGNPSIHNLSDINRVSKKTFGQLYYKTCQKLIDLGMAGYNVIHIWEIDWKQQKDASINKVA